MLHGRLSGGQIAQSDKLVAFLESKGGVAKQAELRAAGFSAGLISSLAERGAINRETRGVYALPDALLDDFEVVTSRWGRAVISHGSALYLHGLTDRFPLALDVTFPRTYNTGSFATAYPGAVVHRANSERYPIGIEYIEGMSGAPVRVYDRERCICDALAARNKNEIDMQTFKGAIGGYFGSNDNNLAKLSEYARVLGVEKDLQRYVEVML